MNRQLKKCDNNNSEVVKVCSHKQSKCLKFSCFVWFCLPKHIFGQTLALANYWLKHSYLTQMILTVANKTERILKK